MKRTHGVIHGRNPWRDGERWGVATTAPVTPDVVRHPDPAGEAAAWPPLLAVPLLSAALDPLRGPAADDARSSGADRPDAIPFVSAAGCFAAGSCADRFGLRRTVAIGLVAWGSSADLGAVAVGPLASAYVMLSLTYASSRT